MERKTATQTIDRFAELCAEFPLRPIRSEEDLGRAIARTHVLIDIGKLTQDEIDYLDALGTLIHAYETTTVEPDDDWTGVDLLKDLLEVSGMSQYQLSKETGIPETSLSQILNGKRSITPRVRKILGKRFSIPPERFAR